ncbi:hypothetical protein MMEU_4676 [Mycobacterium marinum str. Europe]|nr:hypothetical protein MMEU_4676 [Mycobacterium marinum str. Europe]
MSPLPPRAVQPSGTLSVTLGASWSAAAAVVARPSPVSDGAQPIVWGGICSGWVATTPGTGLAGSGCKPGEPDPPRSAQADKTPDRHTRLTTPRAADNDRASRSVP